MFEQQSLEETSGEPKQHLDVMLVSMPFGPLFRPSIGLGMLQAVLSSVNIPSRTLYFTLQFAELSGTHLYDQIASGYPDTPGLVGEWVFAKALFDQSGPEIDEYVEDVIYGRSPVYRKTYWKNQIVEKEASKLEDFARKTLGLRPLIEGFLDACLAQVLDYRPRIVGFTSLFQQQIASLSLAKRIKERAPDTFIVFGGANCEGLMGAELVRAFPFVDAVVSGEGEIVFPELVSRILRDQPIADLQGVYTRAGKQGVHFQGQHANATSVTDMNALPYPEYGDFFCQLQRANLDGRYPTRLQFETSRGCWWGEKHHCTFCGLNGSSMVYRSKTAQRALDELCYLVTRYPHCPVDVVDNILDMKYFKDLIPELASRKLDLELFYEVKANLKKEQLRLMRDAGIREIQPGIESLSNQVLTLMRKGTSGLQNIQLLKWCKELGLTPYWNILWGFPGEEPNEYKKMADLVPLLTHLHPPEATGPLRLDRFSPNFDFADQFGLIDVQPYPAYNYIYPFPPPTVANLAYYFTFEYREDRDVESYTEPLREQVMAWEAAYETSDLWSKDYGEFLLIYDARPTALERTVILSDLERILYLSCDGICSLRVAHQTASERLHTPLAISEIESLLQRFVERRLMIKDAESWLSLAIPVGDYLPKRIALQLEEPRAN